MRVTVTLAYQRLDAIRELFCEYASSLPIPLDFQGFEEELRSLPGKYALPDGRLYIALANNAVAGCIALRRFDASRCEMKRLFVRNAFRGLSIGRILAEKIVAEALAAGYASMLLDTLDSMTAARSLYTALGFAERAAYYHNPAPGAVYMEKILRSAVSQTATA